MYFMEVIMKLKRKFVGVIMATMVLGNIVVAKALIDSNTEYVCDMK